MFSDDNLADIDINDPFGGVATAQPSAQPADIFGGNDIVDPFSENPVPPPQEPQAAAPTQATASVPAPVVAEEEPAAAAPEEDIDPLSAPAVVKDEVPAPTPSTATAPAPAPAQQAPSQAEQQTSVPAAVQSDVVPRNIYVNDENFNALYITVDDAQQISDTVGSHIEYLVEARTSPGGPVQSSVRRRYNNFDWLYQQLIIKNPSVFIPPIPTTNLVMINGDKICHRMIGLGLFLNRVACHPVLAQNPAFNTFLTGDPTQFPTPVSVGPVNSLKPSGGVKNNPDPHLASVYSRNADLGEQFTILDTNQVSYAHCLGDLADYCNSQVTNVSKIGEFLTEIKPTSDAFCKAYDEYQTSIRSYLIKNNENYMYPMNEMRRTFPSVQRSLLYRDDLQMLTENLDDNIDKKTKDKQSTEGGQPRIHFGKLLGKSEEQIKREQLDALTRDLSELNFRKDEATKILKEDAAILNEEIVRWDNQRKREVKAIMTNRVDLNVEFCKRNIDVFKKMLLELESN